MRDYARELAGTAVYTGEPMTLAQVERTTHILAANSQRSQNGEVKRETVNWEAARAQLSAVLSPIQIATLGDIVQQRVQEWELFILKQRLTAEFNAKNPAK